VGSVDIAVNFIVRTVFFFTLLIDTSQEKSPLRRFLEDCLCGESRGSGYLHFAVAEVRRIQNLLENLLLALTGEAHAKRTVSQLTMALLLMELLEETEKLSSADVEETTVWSVLRYIEGDYADASFSRLCRQLHYDPSNLSREIKGKTGKTFTQLVQEKRMSQAAFLLKSTKRTVEDIAQAVGYENKAYFHRLFTEHYGKTPKRYRDEDK